VRFVAEAPQGEEDDDALEDLGIDEFHVLLINRLAGGVLILAIVSFAKFVQVRIEISGLVGHNIKADDLVASVIRVCLNVDGQQRVG